MTAQRRISGTHIAAVVLGILGTLTAQATVIKPNDLSASISSQECHVGPAAGTYQCTVIVDAAPSPSPSAAPSAIATPSPIPTASPTGASTPAPSTTGGPVISGITVAPTPDGATITWNLSPAGTGQVQYGPTSAYGSLTPKESNLLTFHRQTVTGQAAGATVHFRILTSDAAGSTSSADQVFVVSGATPSATPLQSPSPTATPVAGACYGSCIGMDSLANTTLWPGSTVQYFRFRAGQSGPIKTAKIYRLASVPDPGYTLGSGGTWKAEIHADNGSQRPTVAALATQTYAASPVDNAGFVITFANPATAVAGALYYLVITNTDANPGANYWAPDGIYDARAFVPQQPKYPDSDWAWGYASSINGPWTERNEQVPILDVGYGNGVHEGTGYMEISYGGDIGLVSGSSQVRELFTVTGGDRNVSSLGVFGWRTAGSGSMTVTLANAIAGSMASVSVVMPTGSVGSVGGSWESATFPAVTLVNGQTYTLTYASSSTYQFAALRKGFDYGYSPSTVFNDGTAQKSSGGAWSSLGRVAGENDLAFWLK